MTIELYIPVGDLAFIPTSKTWRLMRTAFPILLQGRQEDYVNPFVSPNGTARLPGVVLLVDDAATGPEQATMVTDTETVFNDGTDDPNRVGTSVPMFADVASLPVQPPQPVVSPTTIYLAWAIAEAELYGYNGDTGTWIKLADTAGAGAGSFASQFAYREDFDAGPFTETTATFQTDGPSVTLDDVSADWEITCTFVAANSNINGEWITRLRNTTDAADVGGVEPTESPTATANQVPSTLVYTFTTTGTGAKTLQWQYAHTGNGTATYQDVRLSAFRLT